MILKRMTDSLRRQDWTAVTIEFLLVLIGVLLAFQINEWATERAAREERGNAAQRLLLEAEESVAFFRLGVSAQESLIADLRYALAKAQAHGSGADTARLTAGLSRAIELSTPSPPSSVYDDLVSSGEFGRMGDAQMRASVASYNSSLKFHRETIDYFRQLMPRLEDSRALTYAFDARSRQQLRLDVDLPALRADAVLQEKLALVANVQTTALVLRKRNLKRAIEMCREIGRVAGRACKTDRPPPSFD